MSHKIELGRRVYGVMRDGTIIPTLISKIQLTEVDKEQSESIQRASRRWNGPLHDGIPGVQFRVLNHRIDKAWFTFGAARREACRVLKRLMNDDSISVRDRRHCVTQLESLTNDQETVRKVVDGVTDFAESETSIMNILSPKTKDRRFTPFDFPDRYIEPGTSVWVADTKSWRLIEGYVTEVSFAPNRKGKILYDCGSETNLEKDRVFRTKKGALKCLEREFVKTFPGTLDRRRVPVFQQISREEKFEREAEQFFGSRGRKRRKAEART